MFFEWDDEKEVANILKHGIDFETARKTFDDPCRIIVPDLGHSLHERRWHCYGVVGGIVMTVRFTIRERKIRIIGAGYWRKGRKTYEKENSI